VGLDLKRRCRRACCVSQSHCQCTVLVPVRTFFTAMLFFCSFLRRIPNRSTHAHDKMLGVSASVRSRAQSSKPQATIRRGSLSDALGTRSAFVIGHWCLHSKRYVIRLSLSPVFSREPDTGERLSLSLSREERGDILPELAVPYR
jgi:hypothetical protein